LDGFASHKLQAKIKVLQFWEGDEYILLLDWIQNLINTEKIKTVLKLENIKLYITKKALKFMTGL